jgi:hypothetical protein
MAAAQIGCSSDSSETTEADTGRPNRPGEGDGSSTPDGEAQPDTISADDGSSVPEDTVSIDVPPGPDLSCIEVSAEARALVQPADIIWVVDTSGSMDDEAVIIQDGMNDFTSFIQNTVQLDVRVVMIANHPGETYESLPGFPGERLNGICIPPPLGGMPDNCPAGPDNFSDRYLHVAEVVYSFENFPKFIEFYDDYKWFLRPGVPTHIVIVTDDASASGWTGDRFMNEVDALDPGFPQGYRVHAIAGPPGGGCANVVAPGTEFINAVNATGGYFHSICNRDWDEMFEELATRIEEDSVIPCQFQVPDPGDFTEIDYNRIGVTFEDGGTETQIERVLNEQGCDPATGGYYTDSFDRPTKVLLCPASCGQVTGELSITFECVKA